MTHVWRVIAADASGVERYECKTCGMTKTVYPSTPYPKILWSPRGKKPYYGSTPKCVTERNGA